MTVSAGIRHDSSNGNGVTKEFAVTFPFFELLVTLDNIAADEGTDYTITGGNGGTGTVVFAEAPASGVVVDRYGNETIKQEIDLVDNDPFPANAVEGALDRLTMIAGNIKVRLDVDPTQAAINAAASSRADAASAAEHEENAAAYDASAAAHDANAEASDTSAATHATSAATSATTAANAADTALASGAIYASTTAGLAGTSSGDYFLVAGDNTSSWSILYKNVSGSATKIATYPSRTYLDGSLRTSDAMRIVAQRGWPVVPSSGDIAQPERIARDFTVTRDSVACRCNSEGFIEQVSANVLQHDYDPMTGAYLGWLLEPPRTNMIPYSCALDDVSWSKARVTVTANAATSPNGTVDADFLEETTDTGAHGVTRNLSVTADQPYALSWWVKGVGRTAAYLNADSTAMGAGLGICKFDLVGDGTAGTPNNATNPKITRYRNNWYRIEMTVTPTVTGTMRIYVTASDGITVGGTYTGEAGKGLYAWGAQCEAGNCATSFIPTTSSSTYTRTVTSVTKSIGTATEGTLFVAVKTIGSALSIERILSAFADTNNYASISRTLNTPLYAGCVFNENALTVNPSNIPDDEDDVLAAFSWKAGTQIIAVNGAATSADSPLSDTLLGSMDLTVGTDHGSSLPVFAHVKEAYFFSRFMDSADLEAVTNANFFKKPILGATERTAWAGAVTPTSFAAFSDFTSNGEASLVVSKHPDMIAPVYTSSPTSVTVTSGVSKTYYSQIVPVSDLEPDTVYYWQFRLNGVFVGVPRSLRTAPQEGLAKSFSFAPVSCSFVSASTTDDIFDAIAAEQPAFLLHMGDLVYDNVDTDNIELKRDKFVRQYLAGPSASYLHRTLPVVYTPDNHDCYGPWIGLDYPDFETVMANMRQVYHETVPHYPLEQDRLEENDDDPDKVILAQRWTWGRVRFLMPDVNAQRDNVNHKMLGDIYWDQKQWLFDQLEEADADENIALIVIVSGETWIGRDPNNPDDPANLDSWDDNRFKGDQTAVCDKIESLDTMVTLICGDGHQGGADDGTYGDRSTSGQAKFANFMSSGLKQPANASSIWGVGPFRWNGEDGAVMYVNLDMTLYAIMAVQDNGGNDLAFSMAFKGNPVDTDTKVPTTKLTVASDDVTPAIQFADDTISGSLGETISLDVDKSWFGPVGGCSATWTASDGQTGVVSFKPNSNRATIEVQAPATAGSITVELSDPVRAVVGTTSVCLVTVS